MNNSVKLALAYATAKIEDENPRTTFERESRFAHKMALAALYHYQQGEWAEARTAALVSKAFSAGAALDD